MFYLIIFTHIFICSFFISQQEEQNRQFQQYMLRDPVFDPTTKFPFSRMQSSVPKPLYSPTEVSPRDTRNIPPKPTHYADVNRPEVSPQIVSAAATLANMDIGTRFPFNQQSFKQSDERFLRGVEQADNPARKAGRNDHIVKTENSMYDVYKMYLFFNSQCKFSLP